MWEQNVYISLFSFFLSGSQLFSFLGHNYGAYELGLSHLIQFPFLTLRRVGH